MLETITLADVHLICASVLFLKFAQLKKAIVPSVWFWSRRDQKCLSHRHPVKTGRSGGAKCVNSVKVQRA